MSPTREIRRVAAYCRVLTGAQSTESQVAELRRMTEARGWELMAVIEEKASGAKTRRARQRLIADAKAGHFDAVLVQRLDRWGRSTQDLINSVNELDEAGVAFVCLQGGFDLSTSQGKLLRTIFAGVAEFERDLIRERVLSGVRHAQRHGTKSGKAIGRPRTVDRRLTEIRALANAGESMAAIARKLDLGYASVHRVVRGGARAPAKHR